MQINFKADGVQIQRLQQYCSHQQQRIFLLVAAELLKVQETWVHYFKNLATRMS